MEPITFPQANKIWAKDGQPDAHGQPRYKPLPSYSNEAMTVTCWALTWGERLRLLWTGRLWLSQLNFGDPLQPQKPTATSPFTPER